jgi:hypothetical protein
MTAHRILLPMALMLAGCPTLTDLPTDGGNCATTDMPGSGNPDMTAPVAKCAAAKGLAGDNLLCVDFDKVTQLSDPALAGWKFDTATPCPGWQISGGALQVMSFGTFMGNCGLTLPPIDFKQADKANYQRATLALLYRLDMSDIDQQAQIFMDLDNPSTRLLHQMTGRPSMPTLATTTLTVNKADLPMALSSVYKFFLKVSSSAVSGRPGWQIQSIAVNGLP